MHIPRLVPFWVPTSLGTLVAFLALLLAPSPCAAQSGWAQTVPPEVVLGFQPRTPEEAARPPRFRPALGSLLPEARPAASLAAGDAPGAVWTEWAPPGLCYHSLVRDSRRGNFYVIGGGAVLDPQGLVWRYVPEQGTCTSIATRPGGSGSRFSDAVYDSLRDRLLVVCLFNGRLSLFAMDIAGLAWSEVWGIPANGVIGPAGIAIDTRRDLLALLGAWDPDSSAQRIIRIPLSNPGGWTCTWSPGSTSPQPTSNGCAVYDELRDRFVVVFDAHWSGSSLWSAAAAGEPAWAQLPAESGTGAIFARAVVRDSRLDHLIAVDENAGAWIVPPDGGVADRLDTGNGVPHAAYSTRYGIAAAFDPVFGRLHAHGGQDLGQVRPMFMSLPVRGIGTGPSGAPHVVSPWTTESPGALGSRWFHDLLLDPVGNQLVVLGGSMVPHDSTSSTAVHPLTANAGWRDIDPEGQPQGRRYFGTGYVLDRTRHAVLAFGGLRLDGSGTLDNDLWSLSLEGGGTWQLVETVGARPSARRFTQFFFDAPSNRFILTGGDDLRGYLADAWELRMDPTPTWRELHVGGELPPPYLAIYADEWRGGAWGIYYGVRDGVFRPVYKLALLPDSIVLARVPVVGEVPNISWSMSGFCFDPMGRRLLGFLKPYDDVGFSDIYEVRLGETATWNLLPISGVEPFNRGFIATAFDPGGSRMFMVGGYDDNEDYRGDTWQLQFLDYATPVAISLAGASGDARGAHLRWRLGGAVTTAAVERSRDGVAWEPMGNAHSSGDDLAFDDPGLAPGESAAYRLRVLAGGEVLVSDPVWVTATAGALARLSLRALGAASHGAPSVLVSAPPGEEARLSLLDVSGRRLEAVRLTGGTSTHTFARRPAPGLYFAELSQRGERRVARIVVTP